MQRGLALVIGYGDIRAMIHQECRHGGKAPENRQVQGGAPVLVPGVHRQARLHQDAGRLNRVAVGGDMQQGFALKPRFHGVGPVVDHLLKERRVITAHRVLNVGPTARNHKQHRQKDRSRSQTHPYFFLIFVNHLFTGFAARRKTTHCNRGNRLRPAGQGRKDLFWSGTDFQATKRDFFPISRKASVCAET